MDYAGYNRDLLGHMWFFIVIGVIGVGVCVALLGLGLKDLKEKGKQDRVPAIVKIGAAVLFAVLFLSKSVTSVYETNYDINHQAYISYEGVFEVKSKKNADWLTFTHSGETLTLEWEGDDLSSGTYEGKIIYAEKTGIILEVWVYDQL